MKIVYLVILQIITIAPTENVVDSENSIGSSRNDKAYDDDYDFIIVGNSVPGSIVANRLSENNNWRILVLETDGDPSLKLETTVRKGSFGYNWNYATEDPLYFLKLDNDNEDEPYMPSTLMNKTRIGWNWDEVVKYFENTEQAEEEVLLNPYGYRLRQTGHESRYKSRIQDAYRQEAIQFITDKHAAHFIGLGSSSRSTANDEARGTNDKDRKTNLNILYNTMVTSLTVNNRGFVEKVNYVRKNDRAKLLEAKAQKEYIISAGAYLSPKILMLSGLGPESHLKEKGIKPSCNLPVGQNLQDHGVIPYFLKVQCELDTQGSASEKGRADFIDFIALTNTVSKEKTYPNIMNTCRMVDCKDSVTMNLLLEDLPIDIKKVVLSELKNNHILVVGIHNIKPISKGEVKLHTRNPFDPPVVKNNLFTSKRDIDTMVAGIRQQQKLLQSEAFKNFKEVTPYLESCAHHLKDSDEFWECYIRAVGAPFEDAIGTVKMGTERDPTAVVDACFQVFTTKNLRVIDESVIPTILSGPTYEQAKKIGEKGAALLKKDYPY